MTDSPSPSDVPAGPRLHALPIRLLLPIVLFGSYPLALVFGVGVGWTPSRVFLVTLPSFALLTLAVVPYLLSCGYRGTGVWGQRMAKWLPFGVLVFAVVLGLSAVMGRSVRVDEILGVLGLAYLPVFFAVAPRSFLPRRMSRLLTFLWSANVVHSLIQVWVGGEVVALAGNRNWAATLLACLLPWVWVEAARLRRPLFWTVAGISTALTGGLVWRCHCRATWLALAAYGVLYVIVGWLRGRQRLLACLGVVLLVGVGALFGRDRLARKMAEDIRPPLYEGTLRLALDSPVLGVGPGNFRREYAGRRSVAHQSRRVAASVTEHPHNELLRMMAEVGVPAALAWAALLGFALFGVSRGFGPTRQACYFSAFVLACHGMLDKPLAVAPTSVLAMLFVGMLLRWRLPVRLVAPSGGRVWLQRGLAAGAVAIGAYLIVSVVWRDTFFRRARLAVDEADEAREYAIAVRKHAAAIPYPEGSPERSAALERVGLAKAEAKSAYDKACKAAYEAYAAAARAAPWDVRMHTHAGICASSMLNEPVVALDHLRRARELEPDFAHLNFHIGMALGRKGSEPEALGYFVRETELFPFDTRGWKYLFLCGMNTDGEIDLLYVQQQLSELRLAATCRALAGEGGEKAVRDLAAAFALAAEGGEPGQDEQALALVRKLTTGLALSRTEGERGAGDPRRFDESDVQFWHTRLKWRNAWLNRREDAQSLLGAWQGMPAEQRPGGFAEFAESAGWQALAVNTVPGTVEIRRGDEASLVVPTTGRVLAGTDLPRLVSDGATRRTLGVQLPEGRPTVFVQVGKQRLYERTQHVGYVLHRLLPDSMPKLYASPTALLYAAQRRLERARLPVKLSLAVVPE